MMADGVVRLFARTVPPTEREPVSGSVLTMGERARAVVVTNLSHAGLDVGRLVYVRTCHRLGLFSEWTEVAL